jgi:hypothetical protein
MGYWNKLTFATFGCAGGLAVVGCAVAQPQPEALAAEADRSVSLLLTRDPSEAQQAEIASIRKRVAADPQYRSRLVAGQVRRLEDHDEPFSRDGETRLLREFGGTRAIQVPLERWKSTPRQPDLPEDRAELLRTLADLLAPDERRRFLIGVIDDEHQGREIRLQAIVTLCRTKDPEGIRHVLDIFEEDKREHGSRIEYPPANDAQHPTTLPWDQDADGMADYTEKGLLLDPANPDTDGDGIPDGSDRCPLSAAKGNPSENQRIAQYLFYLHAKYLMIRAVHSFDPLPGVCIIDTTNKGFDSSNTPSLLANVEPVGVNRIVLVLNAGQHKRYIDLHGPNCTPAITIRCAVADPATNEKMFDILEGTATGPVEDGRLYGNGHLWHVRVKKIGNVWLPIEWWLYLTT